MLASLAKRVPPQSYGGKERVFAARFSVAPMADGYERAYAGLIGHLPPWCSSTPSS